MLKKSCLVELWGEGVHVDHIWPWPICFADAYFHQVAHKDVFFLVRTLITEICQPRSAILLRTFVSQMLLHNACLIFRTLSIFFCGQKIEAKDDNF